MGIYVVISYTFFSINSPQNKIQKIGIPLLKASIIFVPIQIFFNYRWNLTAPILSLVLAPILSVLYLIVVLGWWIPNIENVWLSLEAILIEILNILKYFSFSWNFGATPWTFHLIYYLFLFFIFKGFRFQKTLYLLLFLTGLAIVLFAKFNLTNESFFMLNVGNGSSFVYINKWKNLVVVYDCGNGPGYGTTNMADFLKKVGINHIDLLFISHCHQDHYNGLENVQKITKIHQIVNNKTEIFNWQLKGLKILGWKLNNMKNINDQSLIILLQTTAKNILMLGDLTKVGEMKLLENGAFVEKISTITIDLLQLGHHGSRTSSSETFLRVINPKDIFISAGLKNNHQFPDWEVLQLLKKLKLNFYSTANKVNWQYNVGVGKFIFFR